jgi:hypothetical protein
MTAATGAVVWHDPPICWSHVVLSRKLIPYLTAATGEPLVALSAVDGSPKAAHPRAPKWHRLTA